jgi:DUF4097 and DUF4098 domain-containing protein YvlB
MKKMVIILLVIAFSSLGVSIVSGFYFVKTATADTFDKLKNYNIHFNFSDGESSNEYESISQSMKIPMQNQKLVHVSIENGKLTIMKSPDSELHLDFEGEWPKDFQNRLSKSIVNNSDSIAVELAKLNLSKSANYSLTIKIPAAIDALEVNVVSADVIIKNLNLSRFQITGVSGDINFDGVKAKKIELNTVSGDCYIKNTDSEKLEYNSVSANLIINHSFLAAKSIEFNSISGKLVGRKSTEDGFDPSLEFNSISGDVVFE